jgi:hypothetical protein
MTNLTDTEMRLLGAVAEDRRDQASEAFRFALQYSGQMRVVTFILHMPFAKFKVEQLAVVLHVSPATVRKALRVTAKPLGNGWYVPAFAPLEEVAS